MKTWTVSLLAQVPHFADVVAERGWTAWWTCSGVSHSDYRKHLDPLVSGNGLEQGFVAHSGDTYLGSALLIESDLAVRPALGPWVAALWVEQPHRCQGIAADLINAAQSEAARQGRDKLFLCATPAVSAYYLKRGWLLIESEITGLNVFESKTG